MYRQASLVILISDLSDRVQQAGPTWYKGQDSLWMWVCQIFCQHLVLAEYKCLWIHCCMYMWAALSVCSRYNVQPQEWWEWWRDGVEPCARPGCWPFNIYQPIRQGMLGAGCPWERPCRGAEGWEGTEGSTQKGQIKESKRGMIQRIQGGWRKLGIM